MLLLYNKNISDNNSKNKIKVKYGAEPGGAGTTNEGNKGEGLTKRSPRSHFARPHKPRAWNRLRDRGESQNWTK